MVKNLEKSIERLEEKKAEITDKFNDTSMSVEDVQKLSLELQDVNDKIEEKEMQWMELMD